MASSTINLSLLARGVGEVKSNGHERVDVVLEPEDYLYYVDSSHHAFLPPMPPRRAFYDRDTARGSVCSSREAVELSLPKTFTTRKGALLLFSEDMAHELEESRKSKKIGQSYDDADLHTVEDLARNILAYGNSLRDGSMSLLVKSRVIAKKFRPGFSARRYLSRLTRSFDDSFLETMLAKGHINEKTIFQTNALVPHLRRRINDDVSYMPGPYRLLKQMLMAPGILSGYSFLINRTPEDTELSVVREETEIADTDAAQLPNFEANIKHHVSVAIMDTSGDVPRQVSYSSLGKEQKENVLTDLLVKSAISHALEKQKLKILGEDGGSSRVSSEHASVDGDFDLAEAVRSYLESQVDVTSAPKKSSGGKDSVVSIADSEHSERLQEVDENLIHARERLFNPNPVLPPIVNTDSDLLPLAPLPTMNLIPPTPAHSSVTQGGITPKIVTREPTLTEEEAKPWAMNVQEEDLMRAGEDDKLSDRSSRISKRRRVGKDASRWSSQQSLLSVDLAKGPVLAGGSHLQIGNEPVRQKEAEYTSPTASMQSFGKMRGNALKTHRSQQSGSARSRASKKDGSMKGSLVMAPGGAMSVGGSIRNDGDAISIVSEAQKVDNFLPDAAVAGTASEDEAEDRAQWNQAVTDVGKKTPSPHKPVRDTKVEDPLTGPTENDLVNALTEHAHKIASTILDKPGMGMDLSQDAQEVLGNFMRAQGAKSASPTVAEFKGLLKETLASAISKATGDSGSVVDETVVSPELVEALINQALSPDDIEVVLEGGQSVMRVKSGRLAAPSRSLTGGHLYQEPVKRGGTGSPEKDLSAMEVINYQQQQDDGTPLMIQLQPETSPDRASPNRLKSQSAASAADDEKKRSKSTVSQKSKGSDKSEKKSTGKVEHAEEFVVGKPKQNKELEQLYAPIEPPALPKKEEKKTAKPKAPAKKKSPAKKGGKKGKKGKKEEASPSPTAASPVKETLPPPDEPKKELSPSPKLSEKSVPSQDAESEEEMEFIIVRDEFSEDEAEPEPEPSKSLQPSTIPPEYSDGETTVTPRQRKPKKERKVGEVQQDASQAAGVNQKEMRAAKRAAQAEKRRLDVDRKRRQREEQQKREKEEAERREGMQRELEEERRRRAEEKRLAKERQEEELNRLEQMELDKQRRVQLEAEREKKMREEYQKRLEDMKRQREEEEARRREEEEAHRLEEEEKSRIEELMLSRMKEDERLEYERKKREEEERKRLEEEERKRKEEEQARIKMEEARKLAEEIRKRQEELRSRLEFNRGLQLEAQGMEHTQDVSRAFVFSYFELLEWLGLEVPEFERLKMQLGYSSDDVKI